MKKLLTIIAICFSTVSLAQFAENSSIEIGQKAADLKYKNPEGKEIQLSKINKGRYILLDFWASWCRPCRTGNPRLVAIYNKYKDLKFKNAPNGFTIVSVSLDKNKEAWIKAIAHDKMSWEHHMSDLGGWEGAPAATYGVQFIPQAFLIDPDGKIIAKYSMPEHVVGDLEKLIQ